ACRRGWTDDPRSRSRRWLFHNRRGRRERRRNGAAHRPPLGIAPFSLAFLRLSPFGIASLRVTSFNFTSLLGLAPLRLTALSFHGVDLLCLPFDGPQHQPARQRR